MARVLLSLVAVLCMCFSTMAQAQHRGHHDHNRGGHKFGHYHGKYHGPGHPHMIQRKVCKYNRDTDRRTCRWIWVHR